MLLATAAAVVIVLLQHISGLYEHDKRSDKRTACQKYREEYSNGIMLLYGCGMRHLLCAACLIAVRDKRHRLFALKSHLLNRLRICRLCIDPAAAISTEHITIIYLFSAFWTEHNITPSSWCSVNVYFSANSKSSL